VVGLSNFIKKGVLFVSRTTLQTWRKKRY